MKKKPLPKLIIGESWLHPDLAFTFCFDILEIENTDQRATFEKYKGTILKYVLISRPAAR